VLARNPEKLRFHHEGIAVIQGDALNIEAIHELLEGCDAVINAFGQPAKAVPLYSKTTALILESMQEKQIKRYIGVTGASLPVKGDQKGILNRIGEKIFALVFSDMIQDRKKELATLHASEADWTLVRLPFVKEGAGQDLIKVDLIDMPGISIQNGDIASFLIGQIADKRHIKCTPFIAN